MQETVLRGDMPAAEYDPVGPLHEVRGDAGVAPVQHDDGGGGDPGIADAVRHRVQHVVREFAVVRSRTDQQHVRARGQGLLHRGKQPVVGGDVVLPVAGRTARENQRHRGRKDTGFSENPFPAQRSFRKGGGKKKALQGDCGAFFLKG